MQVEDKKVNLFAGHGRHRPRSRQGQGGLSVIFCRRWSNTSKKACGSGRNWEDERSNRAAALRQSRCPLCWSAAPVVACRSPRSGGRRRRRGRALRACSRINRAIRCSPHDMPLGEQIVPHPPGAIGRSQGSWHEPWRRYPRRGVGY